MSGDLKGRLRVELVKNGEVVVDERLASLLMLVEREGSLLKAARLLGIPYSRAWESISKAERILGFRLIEAKRGRGGSLLTERGKEVLLLYIREYRRLTGRNFEVNVGKEALLSREGLLVVGSHDIALEIVLSRLRERSNSTIEPHWIGSLNGVASVLLGEGDVAGVHLFDEDTRSYNITFFKKLGLEDVAVLYRGYERALGFVSRDKLSLEEIIKGIITGELKMVNRQAGSGTRRILDWILREYVKGLGLKFDDVKSRIRGYNDEVSTHLEVGRKVASGEADVGLALKHVAKIYALNFTLVLWENFDFIVSKRSLRKRETSLFIDILNNEIDEVIRGLEGYRLSSDAGKILV